jgi:hypothetical protein
MTIARARPTTPFLGVGTFRFLHPPALNILELDSNHFATIFRNASGLLGTGENVKDGQDRIDDVLDGTVRFGTATAARGYP